MDIFVTSPCCLIIWRNACVKPRWLFGYGASKRTYNVSVVRISISAGTTIFCFSMLANLKCACMNNLSQLSIFLEQTSHISVFEPKNNTKINPNI